MVWLFISAIFNGLRCLELNHEWDLSIKEYADLAESLYYQLYKKLPHDKYRWVWIFNKAYRDCYGENHTCDKISDNELFTFITSIADCHPVNPWPNPIEYCNSLGISYTENNAK